jgi:branched-chain amino acid transport system ATP-binding protein
VGAARSRHERGLYEAVDQATREAPPVVLETRALVMRFGGITATNQVSLQLRQARAR